LKWFKIYNPKSKQWLQQDEENGRYGTRIIFTQDETRAGFWSETEIRWMTIPPGSELISFSPSQEDIRYRYWE